MHFTVTCPDISVHDATAVCAHAPFAFTHAHVGVLAHAAGMFVHEKESDASGMPGC